MDMVSYKGRQDKERKIQDRETPKVGEIAMEVQDRMRNWYGHMVRREEHCEGRMTMEMYGREEGLREDGWME